MMEFFHEAESWVLVAFILFLALLVYLKVPAMLGRMLDERSAKIARELDEARRLREEAQALLDSFKAKRAEAEKEARDIVSQARTDAEEFAAEARRKMTETVDRRSKQAEQKIAQAEAAAIKDVRNLATDIAVAAAAALSAEAVKGAKGAALIEDSIAAVKTRLN
jgi:F-type H+-transporting ATPase subunit b